MEDGEIRPLFFVQSKASVSGSPHPFIPIKFLLIPARCTRADTLFYLCYYLLYSVFPDSDSPCRFRSVFRMQRWTAAPDSAALKCISRKILPSCVSVIFRKKRRKGLFRQSLERIVKPERLRQRDAEQREEKQIIKIQDNGQHQRKQGVQTRQRVGNGSK